MTEAVVTPRRPVPPAGWSLLEDLERQAAADPAGRAVVCVDSAGADHVLTWSELVAASERVAAELLALGVGPGEPVAYQLPNRLDFLAITLGALRIGAACMPLMPIFRERELAFMLAEARARVLYVPDRFRGFDHATLARSLGQRLPALEHVIVLDSARPVADPAVPDGPPAGDTSSMSAPRLGARARDEIARLGARSPDEIARLGARSPDEIAQLLFTSGSTGDPKGVLHRHDVLTRAADAHAAHFGLSGEDVIFIPSPLAHQTGFLYGMWLALRLGATQVAQEHWDAEIAFDAIERHGVTFTQAATPFLADLVRVARERRRAPATLRVFVATGAAVPRELAHAARTVLDAEVGGGFGTTESCMGAGFVPGSDDERAWLTDGRALENVRLRVVDDDGRELPPGVEGNFEILTDTLFAGYLGRPEATAAALSSDGWYRPGDLATIDADGWLRITGRVRDVINRGGEKVPVAEIEQLLYRHPAVAEVAIVAMPDPRLGERACAFVVPASGATLTFAEMQAHLDAHHVAKPYWPERLELVAELPRTPSGKIQKFVLRDRAREFDPDAQRKAAS
ncbi:MAG TPA: AMP-binding protein [Solirubrobacteraceae bacterium]|nr:AMP-binding protein [Solirubrobacteraceae bacterium]